MTPFATYQLIVLFAAVAHAANAAVNFAVFRRPRAPVAADGALPSVSILVPARNEEDQVEACVRSLLAQNYHDFEVVVLDDGSEDRTYEILNRLRDQDHRLRVMVGAELPAGWCGKPHACWQLAKAARGEYLLFTDADCRFAADALLLAMGAHLEHQADLVSLMPDYIAVSFWERVVIPLLVMIPIAFLPIGLVRGSRFPLFAAANGAFLFLRRDDYFRCGGHEAVRGQLAEDVKFAQHAKRAGLTEWYGDGQRVYSVRMYETWAQIWRGFTRNLFPAFSRKLWILVPVMAWIAAVMVLPPVWAVFGWVTHAPWLPLAATAYALMVAVRLGIAYKLKRDSPWFGILNPLSWLVTLLIAAGSIRAAYGGGTEWKGRVYGKSDTPAL